MNIISIHTGHGASLVFYWNNKYYTIDAERVFKKRYLGLYTTRPDIAVTMIDYMLSLAYELWGVENNFDICTYTHLPKRAKRNALNVNEACRSRINAKEYIIVDHHFSHAHNSFYLSPFDEALIISFDGSGNDGVFNAYLGSKENGVSLIKKFEIPSFGKSYRVPGYAISEIRKIDSRGEVTHELSYAGKIMGLSAYGNIRENWIGPFMEYYCQPNKEQDKLNKLREDTGIEFIRERTHKKYAKLNNDDAIYRTYNGQTSYDIAKTNQEAFEISFIKLTAFLMDEYKDLPLCLAGGCSLNVLLNERLRKLKQDKIFIPPNTDDSGLAMGHNFYVNPPRPEEIKNIVYSSIPILDIDKLEAYTKEYGAKKVTHKELVPLLRAGKIIGICMGGSEIGPRALGNRSIVCDPSNASMKDKVNKIKQREWFRPFAPVTRLEDADTYFHFSHESPYMSYAPLVREEYRDKLPAVTHVDGTARLQTVTRDQHEFLYDLLTEFGGPLLNTSFNIKGLPILSSIEDALSVLNETELDHVYIEGYLFTKRR